MTSVFLSSGEEIKLKSADFLGEGGEGSVWSWKKQVIKIALDPHKIEPLLDKYQRLAKIQHPQLITPTELVFTSRSTLAGYVMRRAEGEPLARYFSMAWQVAHHIGEKELWASIESLGKAVAALHANQVIGGDINEFNWTLHKGEATLFDCDAWGVGPWPVSAMLPSIADPLAVAPYKAESDHFALALLVFQLLTGAHPYRGGHPSFPTHAWQERMKAGASLLDPGARFPKGARGLARIPSRLETWLRATLTHQERSPLPPITQWEKTSRPAIRTNEPLGIPAATTRKLSILEQLFLPDRAVGWAGAGMIALADGTVWDLLGKERLTPPPGSLFFLRTPTGERVWVGQTGSQAVFTLINPSSTIFKLSLGAADSLEMMEGRLFAVSPSGWKEIGLRLMGGKLLGFFSTQGVLAGRRLGGENGGLAMTALGGIALLSPSLKHGGGLTSQWKKNQPGIWVWGVLYSSGVWGVGKRNGLGESYWDLEASGASWTIPLDLKSITALPAGGWIVSGEGESLLLFPERNPENISWPAHWVNPHLLNGELWVLSEDQAILITI